MPTITLTTDFGTKDGFVGTMKGVIWGICPAAQLADITHAVSPQNVLEGAFALWRAYSFFPAGTVHLAVIDPGVGTRRRAIAARIGAWTFVGPDNGLFTPVYEDAEANGWTVEIVELTNDKYFLPNVSRTFHGRDLFSPVAAHLANGVPLADLGPAVRDPVRLQLPKVERTPTGWTAHVIAVDGFGNLATDLPAGQLRDRETVRVRVGGFEVRGVAETYGARPLGELVALADSEGRLEVAVVNGSAAQVTGAQVGTPVEVILEKD